ncbi:MAG TPA: GntR family transcriptional regulator [Alphaproteobacteria bacterium]|nr:GntR family transcriptional regulator [Alphaproteobacteria bacterium]
MTRGRSTTADDVAPAFAGRDVASLAEQAYAGIKQRILSLEYRPGQLLNEQAISRELGLGRTPVHQAVHRLSLEGLIEIIPRKGLIIRPDSMNEVLDLLEARSAVESNIAALAAARATPAQIAEMRAMLAESAKITDRRYRQQFMAIDRAFHAAIAQAAGNPILADVIRPLHERSGRLWQLQLLQADDLERTQVEHEAILDGIAGGDKAAAAAAMDRHLASLRRRRITGE